MSVLAAAAEQREAGPIGLVVVLCLLVALIFLIRSMNKHLRKIPGDGFSADPKAGADPIETAPSSATEGSDGRPSD